MLRPQYLMSTYCVLGLFSVCLTLIIIFNHHRILIPVLQMGKPRHRVVNQMANSQWSNWDLDLSPMTPGLECCAETWGRHFEEAPICPFTPMATQRHPGLEKGTGPLGITGYHLHPLFLSPPHPTSHHKVFKMSKGERRSPNY